MIDRLILHIGPHKTGTTSIQKTLLDSREVLAAAGVSYPNVGFYYLGHHGVAEGADGKKKWDFQAIIAALNELDGTVVLSSENFSRISPESIDVLSASLKRKSVEVVYYQRNVLDLVGTWWQEIVKHGSQQTLPEYLADCMTRPFRHHLLHPTGVLGKWSNAFGRESIRAFVYDDLADVTAHFMSHIVGISDYAVNSATRTMNRSFDTPSVELIRALNVLGLKGVDLVQEQRTAGLRKAVQERASNYIVRVPVDFECFVFRAIEKELSSWRDRFEEVKADRPIFFKRASEIIYVSPDMWLIETDLAERLHGFLSEAA